MEQQVATGPHGAGRRRRGAAFLRRPWLRARGGAGGGGVRDSTEPAAAEVKEAGSPYYGARRPFGPAFPGVGVAPTLVVSRLPEYAVPPEQGMSVVIGV